MPTILLLLGWRIHLYSNERNEPIHVHADKAQKECKYWLDVENFNLREAYSYNMSPCDTRDVRKIIFEHFDYIVTEWQNIHGNR